MVNCPYLIYEASHCAGCTGWACNVFGRKKRLSDTSMCVVNEEWVECPRYTTKIGSVEMPEPEPEEEVIELPPTEEVISTQDVGETIKVAVEPKGIGVLSLSGKIPESVAIERAASAPPPGDDCPYLAPAPAGVTCCSDFQCNAINVMLRSYKICKSRPSWSECRRYFKAASQGVT